MIVYADSSILVRIYLPDEHGHAEALALVENPDIILVSGSWTRIEMSGALVRAAHARRGDKTKLLKNWDRHTDPAGGRITLLVAPQEKVEARALKIARDHGLRAMDAWQVAFASLTVPELADGEAYAFASRDKKQVKVAAEYGFSLV